MLNGLALLFASGYTGAALLRGNLGELLDLLKEEKNFIVWGGSLAIVVALYQSETLHPIGKGVLSIAITGLAARITSNKYLTDVVMNIAQSAGSIIPTKEP